MHVNQKNLQHYIYTVAASTSELNSVSCVIVCRVLQTFPVKVSVVCGKVTVLLWCYTECTSMADVAQDGLHLASQTWKPTKALDYLVFVSLLSLIPSLNSKIYTACLVYQHSTCLSGHIFWVTASQTASYWSQYIALTYWDTPIHILYQSRDVHRPNSYHDSVLASFDGRGQPEIIYLQEATDSFTKILSDPGVWALLVSQAT